MDVLFAFLALLALVLLGVWAVNRSFARYEPRNQPEFRLVPHDRLEIVRCSEEQMHYARCGHTGSREFVLDAYGAEYTVSGGDGPCPQCVLLYAARDIIRCARCRLPIVPTEPVVVYEPEEGDLYLEISSRAGDMVLGCMRPTCCDNRPSAGTWTGKTFQSRLATVLNS